MGNGLKRAVAAAKATRRTPDQQAADFIAANDQSVVVAGRSIGNGGKGGYYTLDNGSRHRLGLEAMRLLPEGYPRWMSFDA